ncbi:tudor domain-containing protein 5-like [Colias croceus]|uniref:tudor domain-containing protein 5-like n=1 Tax=Colias crocea TaxID=72248 RepID=UPI001E27AD9E|nr:tudor domain-containing protein 5-like [Colias croceus]XP_045509485.1 tudor domain-containing protein 5-like [Colias croceus]
MDEELKKLKSILRSLVVSSPVTVNMTSLLKDYREMVGSPLPLTKFGYRDPLQFLQERCSDCFIFLGPPKNPELMLIVPDSLKHIDKFVQKQRISPFVKFRGKRRSVLESNLKPNNVETKKEEQQTTKSRLVEEERMDLPAFQSNQNSLHEVESSRSQDHLSSGRLTSSSGRSLKEALEELKEELKTLICEQPEPVWCSDLLDMYKERYGRNLNFSRFGFLSVAGLVCQLSGVRAAQAGDGDWRAWPATAPAPRPVPLPPRRLPPPAAPTDDALPGVAYEPDVFPADCMQLGEALGAAPLGDVRAGDLLEVMLGEVYSPSHFWMMRLGDEFDIALDAVMDEMTKYYSRGEGAGRRLAVGAVREGHCVASCYDGDWHRSVIVRIMDCDTVKVRYVDYGTVEACAVSGLRPLLRRWAALPAQALRARLAGVAPAHSREWPRPAAAAFLAAVRERRLVAHVLSAPQEDGILEVLLIDTSTEEDVCIHSELIRAGHAVLCTTTPSKSESYLYPTFHALENGLTPN